MFKNIYRYIYIFFLICVALFMYLYFSYLFISIPTFLDTRPNTYLCQCCYYVNLKKNYVHMFLLLRRTSYWLAGKKLVHFFLSAFFLVDRIHRADVHTCAGWGCRIFLASVRNCLSYVRKHCANAMAAGSAAAIWADFRKTYQKILDYVTNYFTLIF